MCPRMTVIGRTELVAHVGEELALVGERRLEPVEHRVQRVPELSDLVVAGDVDPPREVRLGDLARGARQRLQRGHRPPGGQPDEERREQHDHDRDADGDAHGTVHLLAPVDQQLADRKRAGLGARLNRDGRVRRGAERGVDSPLRRHGDGTDLVQGVDQRLEFRVGALAGVGLVLDPGDRGRVRQGRVGGEIRLEDPTDLTLERLAARRVDAPGGELLQLGDVVGERLGDLIVDAREQDLAQDDHRRRRRDHQEHEERDQDARPHPANMRRRAGSAHCSRAGAWASGAPSGLSPSNATAGIYPAGGQRADNGASTRRGCRRPWRPFG